MNRILALLVTVPFTSLSLVPPTALCFLDYLIPEIVVSQTSSWSTATINDKEVTDDSFVFNAHHFTEIVALHNDLLPQLAEARTVLATHAEELAQLVKSLPGADLLSESSILDRIRYWKEKGGSVSGATVFQPWMNRWQGVWSNGSPQFHIWDKTRRWGEQWIQVVAQSEYTFPEETQLAHLLQKGKTDLGINVYSEEYGVTGWVSKRQHGRLDIPCVGYVIDVPILLWVCAMDYIDDLNSGEWFVYLEKIERIEGTLQYAIAGHPFTIDAGIFWSDNLIGAHSGLYTAE